MSEVYTYRVRVEPEDFESFVKKIEEISPNKEIINIIYMCDNYYMFDLLLEGDEDLTALKLFVNLTRVPSNEDRSEMINMIRKGSV